MSEHDEGPIDPNGPPDGIMARTIGDIEDAADLAIARAKAFYEQIMGESDEAERLMNLRRLTEEHRESLSLYERTMDQISFVLKDTIHYLQKASDRMHGLQQKMKRLELLYGPTETSKTPPERSQ